MLGLSFCWALVDNIMVLSVSDLVVDRRFTGLGFCAHGFKSKSTFCWALVDNIMVLAVSDLVVPRRCSGLGFCALGFKSKSTFYNEVNIT